MGGGTTGRWRTYCTRRCQERAKQARNRPSQQPESRACVTCGNEFYAVRSSKRTYCSAACQPDYGLRVGGAPVSTLTPRQQETLMARFRYGSVKDAAAAMGIGLQTAKNHSSEAFRRLGVENSEEAAYVLWLKDLWGE